ncbi:MAG: hypothetical protein K2N87_14495 [Eubacterium sp.]|nr:hypothetical protein [Eubacterium sp.]
MNTKRCIAGGMALLMLAGSVFGNTVHIPAKPRQEIQGESEQPPIKEVREAFPAMIQTEFIEEEELLLRAGTLSIKRIQMDDAYSLSDSIWADSGSDYYFGLLNTEEKKLYLNLKKQADRYMTGTEPFQTTEVNRNGENATVCILPLVSYDGLSTAQMKKVFYCFLYENPQYYFMRNSVIYSENSNMMTVGLYEIFADGQARADYTSQFASQLLIWDEQVAAAGTALEKEQLIHRLVCDEVDYDEQMAADDPDDKQMSQSCISAVLFDKKTVCAGYAQMFTLLCGRAGITCVTVTSPGHAWNKVRIGNVWYNVDCTWNDSRGDDTFFNVTDEQLLAADTPLQEHVPSEEWAEAAPACTAAFDPQAEHEAAETANITAPEKMPDTVVLSSAEAGTLSVAFEPMEGCDGYTVQYASNGAMLPAELMDTEDTSCVIGGLAGGNAYYVRVRAFRWNSKGEKVYGTFSKKVKQTVA